MAETRIVLTDKETVILEEGETKQTAPLSIIQASLPHLLMPESCILHLPDGLHHLFVIEQPPCTRHVRWQTNTAEWESLIARGGKRKCQLTDDDATREVFCLAFPYTVFLVCVEGLAVTRLQLFFRNHVIQSPDDYLLRAGLLTEDLWVLEDQTKLEHHGMTPASITNLAIEHYWEQTFGNGSCIGTHHPNVPEVMSVWEWEHFSHKPDWIFHAQWAAHNRTLVEACRDLTHLKSPNDNGRADPTFTSLRDRLLRSLTTPTSPETQDHIESPRLSMTVGTTKIRQGDELLATKKDEGIKKDQHYLVVGFYELRGSSHVYAHLEGIAHPVCIGYSGGLLNFTLVVHTPPVVNELMIDGMVWQKGVSFISTDSTDLPTLSINTPYVITALEVDTDGDAKIKVGSTEWMYITYEGGKLLPSIKLMMPRLADDTFTYGTLSARVGMVVKVLSGSDKMKGLLLIVSSLTQENDTYFVTFEGRDEQFKLFHHGLKLTLEVIPYEFSEQRVVFGTHVLDLTLGDHLLVTQTKLSHQYGSLYKTEGLIRHGRSVVNPFDVDLCLSQGNEPIPVIQNSVWVFPEGYEPATTQYTNGCLTLNAGEVLVCQTSDIPLVTKQEELQILCFAKNKTTSGNTDLVTPDGRSLQICLTMLTWFTKKTGVFTREECQSVPEIALKTGRVQPKDRVRGISTNRMNYVGIVREKSYDDRQVEWDNLQNREWIHFSHLAHENRFEITRRFFDPAIMAGGMHLVRSDGSIVDIPPELLIEQAEIRGKTKVSCGKDRNGAELFVGDFVTAQTSGFDRTLLPEIFKKIPLLIVHFNTLGNDFAYVWGGTAYRVDVVGSKTYGFDNLPHKFRGTHNGQLAAVKSDCCELQKITS